MPVHVHYPAGSSCRPRPLPAGLTHPAAFATGRAVLIRQHRQQYLRLAAQLAGPVSMPGSLVVARRALALACLSQHDLLDLYATQAAPFRLGGA